MLEQVVEQDEIDRLLNEINGMNGEQSNAAETVESSISIGEGIKVFKPFKKPVEKFTYPHKSSVIKKDNIILNPDNSYVPDKNKVVVYTLPCYLAKRKMKQAAL